MGCVIVEMACLAIYLIACLRVLFCFFKGGREVREGGV